MSLPKEIRDILPDVIVDYIGEFNADHRDQMKEVINEIFIVSDYRWLPFTKSEYYCDGCDELVCNEYDILTYRNGHWVDESPDYREDENEENERNTCSREVLIKEKFLGNIFCFCGSYCRWDVLYDIRKSYSRGRLKWSTKYSEKVKNEFAEIKYMERMETESMFNEDKKDEFILQKI